MRPLSNIILLLFILGTFSVSTSASLKCDLCKKEISGKYVTGPDNTIYCWDCYSKYQSCSVCGKLYKSLINVEDKKVCRDCYSKLDKCDICGKPIMGSYVSYPELGMKICNECEKTAARCDACGRPGKTMNRVGTMFLCDVCASRTNRCYSCGDAILGTFKYFENDESKKYCLKCVSEYPSCADCGAPSGPTGTRLDDGRYLCPDCRRYAIFNPAYITPIKKDVLEFLRNGMRMQITHDINYSVQDKKSLEKKSKHLSKDINGLFYRKNDDFNVYVLYGLRKQDLIWVLAHEMTHAWQSENCSQKLTDLDREGFAQWIAYHTAMNFGYRQYGENMRSGESLYCSGLNKMIDIEKNEGFKAVFDYIKSR
jgi:hypothetical protein